MDLSKYIIQEHNGVMKLTFGEYNDSFPNYFELLNDIYGDVPTNSDEGDTIFKAWCEENNVYYYARIREDFFKHEGWNLAIKAGAEYVLMEDLS